MQQQEMSQVSPFSTSGLAGVASSYVSGKKSKKFSGLWQLEREVDEEEGIWGIANGLHCMGL